MIRLFRIGIVALTMVASGALAGSPGASDPVLTEDMLKDQLTRELPPLWHLESFALAAPAEPAKAPAESAKTESAKTESGKAGDDQTVIRSFTATISLTVATYALDRQRGAFTLLRPVADQGSRKTISGLVKSVRQDGGWVSHFGIQNGYVIGSMGQPIDRFPGRTLVVGSPEAVKLLADLDQIAKDESEAQAAGQHHLQDLLDQQIAVVKIEAQRIAADRALIDQRTAQLADLKRQISEGERGARIAALEAALNGKDASQRAMAFSAALSGRDPVVANLALRVFLFQKKTIPIQLFATRENKDSEAVVNNLGPLTLTIDRFDSLTGNLEGKLGAPGYSITLPGAAFGFLAQTELTINTYGCSLLLRLTEFETLDGSLRCQTLPPLLARITLD